MCQRTFDREKGMKEKRQRQLSCDALSSRFILLMNATVSLGYLLVDGISVFASSAGIVVSVIYLLAVFIIGRRCRSVANLIACVIQMSICFLSSMNLYSMAIVLNTDLFGIRTRDPLCIWRTYFVYTEIAAIYYSFVTQSYYGYMRVIHAAHPQYTSLVVICTMIGVQWLAIHAVMLILPLGHFIQLEADSHLCSVSFSHYTIIWFMAAFVYMPAVNIITFVYIRLVLFTRRSRTRVLPAPLSSFNARRELSVIKRLMTVLLIFSVSGLPYTIYSILALIDSNSLPSYHYRLVTGFNTVALAIGSSAILLQTADVRRSIVVLIRMRQERRVHPRQAPR